jgi:hypothetical protein
MSWWWKAPSMQENDVRSLLAMGRKQMNIMQGKHSDNSKCDTNVGHDASAIYFPQQRLAKYEA